VCDKIDIACDVVSVIGRVGSSVTTSVFGSIASGFGNTADSAINWLWQQLSTSTTVSLSGANFELDLGIAVAIAAVLCLGLFVVQVVISALKRDAGGIGRGLRGLVIATVGCAITLATLNVLLAAVDQLCVGVVKVATGGTIATMGTKIIGGAVFTTALASPPTVLILSLVALVAVAIVWFAMVIRKMLIVITAVFAPIAFAGGVADVSRGWVRKWLEAMLALVFSKLILILIFVIGLGVLGGMGSATGGTAFTAITQEITGLLILLVAGFSPWMALRLVHFTGDHVATMAHSASSASAGAKTIVGAPQKMAQLKYSAASLGAGRARPLESSDARGTARHHEDSWRFTPGSSTGGGGSRGSWAPAASSILGSSAADTHDANHRTTAVGAPVPLRATRGASPSSDLGRANGTDPSIPSSDAPSSTNTRVDAPRPVTPRPTNESTPTPPSQPPHSVSQPVAPGE